MVSDNHGRQFTGLRVSVTQRCNLSCPHCHREGQQKRSATEMTPEEIGEIVAVAASLGASKVKLTGGEPLLRDDICEIVAAMRPHVREISMTTNGIRLEEMAGPLKRAGLDRINVSIHSLDRERLQKISGRDCLDDVKRGLLDAGKHDLRPIKLNMVVLGGINNSEIADMMRFSSEMDAYLQLIELSNDRSGCNDEFFQRHYFSLAALENDLTLRASSISHNELHRRARYRILENGTDVTIEIVRSMHNSVFCANCRRLRLTSDGRLKGCLYENDHSPDVLSALRAGQSREDIAGLFADAIRRRKPYWN